MRFDYCDLIITSQTFKTFFGIRGCSVKNRFYNLQVALDHQCTDGIRVMF